MLYSKKISFLLPGAISSPGGGYKIILEHANNLAQKGHNVTIECPVKIDTKKSLLKDLNFLRLYYKRKYRIGYSCDSWFALHPNVKVRWIWSLDFKNVAPADIYIATEVRTSIYLNTYPVEPSNKFYFIQGYENWFVTDEVVKSTYRFPMTKMAIANWLVDIVNKEDQPCALTPNGFNTSKFHITEPIANRCKYTISMLYHWQELKDIPTAITALKIVKEKFPQLKVLVFGEMPDPQLPEWFVYYRRPNDETHLALNNQAAIYVGSSKIEGFGLTVGEAMLCGQVVACTDNLGYQEMAKHEQTALISPVGDPQALAHNIIRLIDDDQLRFKLAEAGNAYIKEHFSWEKAHQSFDNVLGLK